MSQGLYEIAERSFHGLKIKQLCSRRYIARTRTRCLWKRSDIWMLPLGDQLHLQVSLEGWRWKAVAGWLPGRWLLG